MEADSRRKIIFYGDSNTYGYDPADPYDQRLPYPKRWTTLVSGSLKESCRIIPEGMNGRIIPEPLYEQPYLMNLISLAGEDGIFCTLLGTNDILLTFPPDASAPIRKMEQYILFLKQYLDQSRIMVIAPVLIGNETGDDPLSRKYFMESKKMNEAFREIASNQGILFADASEWGIDLAFDRVHFSEEGHRTFAGKMTELLKGIL